ncbi:MAG: UDP-N-acetylmuramoyl-L-alanyl-D-glutamate--2,6-diaminopimelate ligase [Planctomycetes bacterium]|nr:UDP-N-acetylmuramoyl-L-alanyl-D-glutamate--2,6-diaminopimelate ligase [Planctomycetota bacterium]
MRLEELIARSGDRAARPGLAKLVAGQAGTRICDITEDSRTVLPGSLFVARTGTKVDGRQFVQQAVRAGAAAVLCRTGSAAELATESGGRCAFVEADDVELAAAMCAEVFYGSPSDRVKCVGVTGTNGKTTTTWLLWRMLNSAGLRSGLIGTVVVDDGSETARAEMTTPPAIELSRSFGVMAENGCQFAAMEVSSHSLAQQRVAGLRFRIGVFTNLTQDHLDFHKTMESYAEAKTKLFGMLPPDGLAVVNADDPAHELMVRKCAAPVVRCHEGTDTPRDGASVAIEAIDRAGMKLALNGPFGKLSVWVPLIGAFNAMNVLQAVVCAHACGLSTRQIMEACPRLDAPPGRLERVPSHASEPLVLVDFAHTDDGLKNALETVRRVVGKGRLIAVFGCGGDKDKTKRPKMGRVAASLADIAVVTSDNPRTERPGDIIDMVLEGVPPADREKVTVQADRRRAIMHALSIAQPADIVVIAGKGHETEQILPDGKGGTQSHHFDDREVAREALAARREAAKVSRVRA